mmetsp:Transcript_33883/g.82145  ORF Transcript_33883/g.82145 Transcript_33883/m.82145 type:complete len:301 (+) Transcript_33883:1527-2429(+)
MEDNIYAFKYLIFSVSIVRWRRFFVLRPTLPSSPSLRLHHLRLALQLVLPDVDLPRPPFLLLLLLGRRRRRRVGGEMGHLAVNGAVAGTGLGGRGGAGSGCCGGVGVGVRGDRGLPWRRRCLPPSSLRFLLPLLQRHEEFAGLRSPLPVPDRPFPRRRRCLLLRLALRPDLLLAEGRRRPPPRRRRCRPFRRRRLLGLLGVHNRRRSGRIEAELLLLVFLLALLLPLPSPVRIGCWRRPRMRVVLPLYSRQGECLLLLGGAPAGAGAALALVPAAAAAARLRPALLLHCQRGRHYRRLRL